MWGWQITGISYRKARTAEKQGHKSATELRLRQVKVRTSPSISIRKRSRSFARGTGSVLRKWHRDLAKERLALGRAYATTRSLVHTRADRLPLDPTQVCKVFKRLVLPPKRRQRWSRRHAG